MRLTEITPAYEGSARSLAAGPNKGKVFNWDEAGRILRERGLERRYASAGLAEDWDFTGGSIFADGQIVSDGSPYIKSAWATPVLVLHDENPYEGEVIPCFVEASSSSWDSGTVWPMSALVALRH